MMNKNNRMEALKANGVDTSKYFTITVNENIPVGTKINVEIDKSNADSVVKQIVEDGYVKNTKLHRRFICAHYMRMLESPYGWYGYLNMYYGYMYQFDMMFEEVRVLSKLEKRDRETFNERRRFFTFTAVQQILNDYVTDLKKYLKGLPIKRCKGRPYVRVAGYGNIFVNDIDRKIINPIEAMVELAHNNCTYSNLYESLKMLKRIMIKLPYTTKKSKTWTDTFQKEGAFYTLKNLLMFHDVKLYYEETFYDKYTAMEVLNQLVGVYMGYQMNALLKETINKNNFDLSRGIEAYK